MRYYALYNENNELIAIGTGYGGVEITKEHYDALLAEIRAKADLVNKIYNGELAITNVPTKWQEEIQRRVNELIAQDALLAEETAELIERGETLNG